MKKNVLKSSPEKDCPVSKLYFICPILFAYVSFWAVPNCVQFSIIRYHKEVVKFMFDLKKKIRSTTNKKKFQLHPFSFE